MTDADKPLDLSDPVKGDTALTRALPAAAAAGAAAGTAAVSGLAGIANSNAKWISQLSWGAIAAVFMVWFYRDMRSDAANARDDVSRIVAEQRTAFLTQLTDQRTQFARQMDETRTANTRTETQTATAMSNFTTEMKAFAVEYRAGMAEFRQMVREARTTTATLEKAAKKADPDNQPD